MSKDRREETGSQAQTEGDNKRTGKCLKTNEKRQVVRHRQREIIREQANV